MNDSDLAQVFAFVLLLVLVVLLYVKKRDVYVAITEIVYPPHDTTPDKSALSARGEASDTEEADEEEDKSATAAPGTPAPATTTTYRIGDLVPERIGRGLTATQVRRQRRSWLATVIVGADNRTSTSKTVAFAWTLAVVWGLLALMFALWLGDDTGWNAQGGLKLQDEYLLLLGGPYAAAVLAKAITSGRSETKADGEPGGASAAQLVTDDAGDAELGDLQYALFNVIALLFFLGAFIGDTEHGFPQLPDLLTGLALTSVAGYSAKKFLTAAAPKMISVVPTKAAAKGDIQIFGSALTVPAGVSEAGADVPPTLTVGGIVVPVTAQDKVLGNDRLSLKLPDAITAGSRPIMVTRADGASATTPMGENVLAFEVT